jgi:hypothetical protein
MSLTVDSLNTVYDLVERGDELGGRIVEALEVIDDVLGKYG